MTVVLYDHRGTLAALLTQTSRALSGQRAQRLGLLAPGGTEEVNLLHSKDLKSFLTLCVETQPSFAPGLVLFSQVAACQRGPYAPTDTENSGKNCVAGWHQARTVEGSTSSPRWLLLVRRQSS